MKKKKWWYKWDGEWCKKCGRPNKMGFSVDLKVWREIVPKELQNKTVCLDCFDEFAKEKNINYFRIKIYWAGYLNEPQI